MSIGIALLVHQDFDRVVELVQTLQKAGCKTAIHVDAKAEPAEYEAFFEAVRRFDNVVFAPRHHCEWGRFSLVEAQLATAELLLENFADVSHVVMLSGSCLPNRPLSELGVFLNHHKDTDFIESVIVGGVNWTKGGLEAERFSQHFPVSFVKHRRVFDLFVAIQRKFGIKRKLPEGLTPHIGSQWWTLTRATMLKIINDPRRPEYDRFFAKSWIPDESYFQTLARAHSQRIKSRSLTYSRFDFRGKPMMFYDDHASYIVHLDSYFVRKVWPGADGLYQTLLDQTQTPEPRNPDMAVAFNALIAKAESRWLEGRPGLVMQSRAPRLPKITTATPYTILSGFDRVFIGLAPWLQQKTGVVLFENLFADNQEGFTKAAARLKNNLGTSIQCRDHNPEGFLLNFIWNHSDDDPVFTFDQSGHLALARFIANDPNARVFHIRSAWLLDLQRENLRDIEQLLPRVQAYALKEQAQLAALAKGKAKTQIIPLAEIYAQPGAVLEQLLTGLRPSLASQTHEIPGFLPYEGLEEYIEFLKDAGLNLNVESDHTFNLAGESA